jgi:hypothetical protein
MKDSNTEFIDPQMSLQSVQAQLSTLRERVNRLELGAIRSGKDKKSKKKHKGKKSDHGSAELARVLREASHEQLLATILRYHKNPDQIARKIAREGMG